MVLDESNGIPLQRHANERLRADMSRMITELNEVRMRLDAIVRRLDTGGSPERSHADVAEQAERLRVRLAGQVDRIRQKLLERLPEQP